MENVKLSFKAAEIKPNNISVKQTEDPVNNSSNVSDDGGKSLLLGLAALASTAIAGIALYKNHNIQKQLNKTLKKLEETQSELKKVTKNAEEKIKNSVEEAVNKVKVEVRTEAKPEVTPPAKKRKHRTSSSYRSSGGDTAGKDMVDRSGEDIEKLAREGAAIIDAEEAALRKAKKASDLRNQDWVARQRKIEEQRYSDEFNKAMDEKLAREGEAIIDAEEAALRKAKKASDLRNQDWVDKQHRTKEQEYNRWFEENKEAFDAIEENADLELTRKAENLARRNEIEEEFNKHRLRLNYLNAKATVRHFYNKNLEPSVNRTMTNIKHKYSELELSVGRTVTNIKHKFKNMFSFNKKD